MTSKLVYVLWPLGIEGWLVVYCFVTCPIQGSFTLKKLPLFVKSKSVAKKPQRLNCSVAYGLMAGRNVLSCNTYCVMDDIMNIKRNAES